MAEFKGRRCDRQTCVTVVENVQTTPTGWIKMNAVVDASIPGGSAVLEYCSDYCAAIVLVERYEDNTGKRFQKPKGTMDSAITSDARIEGGRRAAHTRLHTNKGDVNPNCEYCVRETESVG